LLLITAYPLHGTNVRQ